MARGVVERLRSEGHDVLRAYDAGNANRRVPDESVLAFAFGAGRIVFTGDRGDFIRLHRSGEPHGGIVAFTNGHPPDATGGRIDAALRDVRAKGRFLLRVDGVAYRFDP